MHTDVLQDVQDVMNTSARTSTEVEESYELPDCIYIDTEVNDAADTPSTSHFSLVENRINLSQRLASLEVQVTLGLERIENKLDEVTRLLKGTEKFKIEIPFNNVADLEARIMVDPEFGTYIKRALNIYEPSPTECPNSFGLARILTDAQLTEYNWVESHNSQLKAARIRHHKRPLK